MTKRVLLTSTLLYFLCLHAVYANQENIENPTLQKVIEAAQPQIDNFALSATFVRTQYTPQKIGTPSENDKPEILRTSISELVANSSGIKESLCDSRAIGEHVKQYAYHYSNNGIHSRTYDSRNNYATARKSSNTIPNYLSLVQDPYVAGRRNRFISRATPTFFSRLSSVSITSETDVVLIYSIKFVFIKVNGLTSDIVDIKILFGYLIVYGMQGI